MTPVLLVSRWRWLNCKYLTCSIWRTGRVNVARCPGAAPLVTCGRQVLLLGDFFPPSPDFKVCVANTPQLGRRVPITKAAIRLMCEADPSGSRTFFFFFTSFFWQISNENFCHKFLYAPPPNPPTSLQLTAPLLNTYKWFNMRKREISAHNEGRLFLFLY